MLGFVLIVCLNVAFCVKGEPSWRKLQSNHSMAEYDLNYMTKVCEMTDRQRLRNLLTPILKVRPVGSKNLKETGQFIGRTMRNAGFQVKTQKFDDQTPHGVKTFRNIIATYEDERPRRLVLACHYDSKYSERNDFIGATDSAAPCAMMLDIAVTLGPHLYKRKFSDIALQMIFFDGEEAFDRWTDTDSLYGSRFMAEQMANKWFPSENFYLNNDLERMDVMVLLDLLGAKFPKIVDHQKYGASHFYQEMVRTEGMLGESTCLHKNIPQIFHETAAWSPVEDDHVPFYNRGVKIVHLIATPFPRVWHQRGDDESALDYDTMENIMAIMRVWVARYLHLKF